MNGEGSVCRERHGVSVAFRDDEKINECMDNSCGLFQTFCFNNSSFLFFLKILISSYESSPDHNSNVTNGYVGI